jgi:hypothetical protein
VEDVARRWFGDPRDRLDEPDDLANVAGQLDAIANLLAPTVESGGSGMRDRAEGWDSVGLATRRFAVVLRRLAASERAQMRPIWSANEEKPIAARSYNGSEPEFSELEVDAFSLFLLGDLLLEEIATAELRRSTGATGNWTDYLDWLDNGLGDDRMTATARELNWVLRAGRNHLVAHPRDGFELGVATGSGGSVALARTGPVSEEGDRAYDDATRLMREVAAEVGMEFEADAEFAELLDLVEFAGVMTKSHRQRVYEAFSRAGYGTVRLDAIARLVRDLVLGHARARGLVRADKPEKSAAR